VEGAAFFVALALVVLADQAIKFALTTALPQGRVLHLGPVVRIRWLRATTIAETLRVPRWFLALAWVAILGAVAFVSPQLLEGPAARVGLGVALGGAASNLLDHRLHGGVVDYVDLRIWPAFNLADAAIVVGVVVALVA
jgi:signal peptidase II